MESNISVSHVVLVFKPKICPGECQELASCGRVGVPVERPQEAISEDVVSLAAETLLLKDAEN